jgi:hypothetical protein
VDAAGERGDGGEDVAATSRVGFGTERGFSEGGRTRLGGVLAEGDAAGGALTDAGSAGDGAVDGGDVFASAAVALVASAAGAAEGFEPPAREAASHPTSDTAPTPTSDAAHQWRRGVRRCAVAGGMAAGTDGSTRSSATV